MKKLFFSLVILLSSITGISQDKIYLTDNSVISAKIIEISVNEVKYKKSDNLTGPDYVIPKTTIALIIYENGTHEVMNATKTNENAIPLIDSFPYYDAGKNLIRINYMDLIFKNISLGYTRYFCNNHFSAGINASAGFTYNDGNRYSGNSFLNFDRDYFHASLAFNYFPAGMQKICYYTGLSLMAGQGVDFLSYYNGYNYSYSYEWVTKNYYGFYVNNGVQFNITKHFNMRTSLAIGLVDRDMQGNFETHAIFEIAAGIRF